MGGRKMMSEDERRRVAREARKQGKAPSEVDATLGAARQRRHVERDDHEERTKAHEHQPWANRPRQSRRVK
jgi:hypothetical protein